MPFAVGGGIRSIDQIQKLIRAGAEKVVINSYATKNPDFILQASEAFGSSSIIVSIDLKKNIFGNYNLYSHCGTLKLNIDPWEYIQIIQSKGAGEILVSSINLDGTMDGYDISLIKRISKSVTVPVIGNGGAGTISNFYEVVDKAGASAAAAGSLFVYHGKRKAFLINYPNKKDLSQLFN